MGRRTEPGSPERLGGVCLRYWITRRNGAGKQLWGAAQTLHETKGVPRDTDFLAEADARISAVRSGMGEKAWEEAWRKGRAMTLEEAVSYALEREEKASG